MVSYEGVDKFLNITMDILVKVLRFDRAILMLKDTNRQELYYRFSTGGDPKLVEQLKNYRVPLSREQNLMVRVARRGKPILISDVERSKLNKSNVIIARFKPFSFCMSPLKAGKEIIGVLGADRTTHRQQISQKDLDYLSVFANNIAVSILRAQLVEEIKSSYLSSVKALALALEEKDPYTRGHSERVADISVKIAEELGLSSQEKEYIKTGAMLHDIGKIGIPESIVRSPKALTKAEFNIIKTHTTRGVEILGPIDYFKNHLHLIRNHHEHYDGRGYPDRLKGEEIPIGAQIIAVADSFDAMTSSRPYRKGLPPRQAKKEITVNTGSQFSPKVGQAFEIIFEKGLVV